MLRDLIGDEEELARRLIRLAEDEGLKARLDTLIASARSNILPPDFEALTKGENADWPSDAILYVLYTWLRLGLRQILEMFNLIEDTAPFEGKFKISDLLAIIGLDFPLNDATLADLKAKFTPAKTAEN
jgi:hypothetical protein